MKIKENERQRKNRNEERDFKRIQGGEEIRGEKEKQAKLERDNDRQKSRKREAVVWTATEA